ncbi:MAG: FliI/YscN family ATPase [Spirochaetia bacterium]|nr:FliI/YscN family ATPase [Spirochaetota bacterium]MCX8096420.1 FliI/YscN family ATPase [Spirochaetota bacterium]MDW8113176.1 FliI/YscN family ATPase [Spirochaetia bacterium]
MSVFEKYIRSISRDEYIKSEGRVVKVKGVVIESLGPYSRIGDLCEIETGDNKVRAEVVGFDGDKVFLLPLEDVTGLSASARVLNTGKKLYIPVGEEMKGRVINAYGEVLVGGEFKIEDYYSVDNDPPNPLERKTISKPIQTGIKAIDGLLTVGEGQRVGIFSGSGIGKSTLLGMIARNTSADIVVLALVGERGREVREFLEKVLGEEGLKRSVVLVATSDEPPMARLKVAYSATAVAEFFRDKGYNVLLLLDSLTRLAFAQREISLSIGEPPTTRGYTPSVFTKLPRLLERAGPGKSGSITAFYTVLVEGDDVNEPISDHVRATLDGHIVLSRQLASAGIYPAVDVLSSISRLMVDIVSKQHLDKAYKFRDLMATYRENQDLINIGAYVQGSNPKIDMALKYIDKMLSYIKQDIYEKYNFNDSVNLLLSLF